MCSSDLGGIASVAIFAVLIKFAGPMVKKSMSDRTDAIQKQIDASSNDLASAQADAANIRTALGDIAAEKSRLLSDANAQAAALLSDGRARLTAEVADLEAKADADIAAAAARGGDELRAEIARVSAVALDKVLPSVLDDATQQSLVENFITKVGASR